MDNSVELQAPPPAQLVEVPPQQLPSLPTEILQRIILLALPRLSFKTFRERYDILLNCCRVNKLWASLAQRDLLGRVLVVNSAQYEAFAACRRLVSPDAVVTKELRLNNDEPHGSTYREDITPIIEEFGRMLPSLRSLWLLMYTPGPFLDLQALSEVGQDLFELVLGGCRLKVKPGASPATIPFHALRSLALSYTDETGPLAPAFAALDLPCLEALSVVTIWAVSEDELAELGESIRRHGSRLKSLRLWGAYDTDCLTFKTSLWRELTSLQTLSLDHRANIAEILPHLPHLASLQIHPSPRLNGPVSLTALLEAMKSTTPSLQSLFLPPATLTSTPSEREQIVERCRALGTTIIDTPGYASGEGNVWMQILERSLDF